MVFSPKAQGRDETGRRAGAGKCMDADSPRGPALRHILHLNKTETAAEVNLARIKMRPKNKLNLASTRAILHRNLEC